MPIRFARLCQSALLLAVATPAIAYPGGWGGGGPGSGGSRWDGPGLDGGGGWRGRQTPRSDSGREGKVEVSRFVAEGTAAEALGHGIAVVTSEAPAGADVDRPFDQRGQKTFEAAVVDRLAAVGYDTASKPDAGGSTSVQAVELRITRDEVVPEEQKRSPVSGEMTVGASSRGGTFTGMAFNVDLTRPRKALVSTRLTARILDRATNAVLWEGRADIVTRDGDDRWNDTAIAERLAGALFDGFPRATGGA